MITLNIGVSKKQQGEEQYSSVGANCSISCEASDELVKNPPALQARIAGLFEEVKAAVDQQIANGSGKANGNGKTVANGNGNGTRVAVTEEEPPIVREPERRNPNQDPIITPAQKKFLIGLLSRRFKGGIRAFEEKLKADGINSIGDLSRKQASVFLEDLAGKNGGGK
jgi:hypothetical protein